MSITVEYQSNKTIVVSCPRPSPSLAASRSLGTARVSLDELKALRSSKPLPVPYRPAPGDAAK